MRVLMLTPDSQMIDRRILQEARTLIEAGHQVTLLAGFECKEPSRYAQHGIDIHRFTYDWDDERLKKIRARLPQRDRLIRFVNNAFMHYVRKLLTVTSFDRFVVEQGYRHPADVVHVHDYPALYPGVLLARKWGVPLVYDAHEIYHAQESLPAAVRKKYRKAESKLVHEVTAMITVNEFCAKQFATMYGIKTPAVIHNCADDTTLPTDPNTPTLKERLGVTGPIVLFQGWLSAERNIHTVVEAMRFVPEAVSLGIIGYGACEPALRARAAELGLSHRVHFTGAVPAEEMLSYTRGADLGVIPYLPIDDNHRFCSPNKFFEFGLAEVPILAHELPFFQTMRAQHGVVACTDFASPETVGRTITQLLASGEMARMKAACVKARDLFSWECEGKKLLDLYARLRPAAKKAG